MTPRHSATYRRWIFPLLFLSPFLLYAGQPTLSTTSQAQLPPTAQRTTGTSQTTDTQQTATVDYYGDLMTKRDPQDTALYLIGNVIFHHNGTFIQCDSAKRYDEYRMECFGSVVINKDSTYIYGDRASYNGHTNIAEVYSPLLKVVNGDATMWVFNYMEFNSQTNIGAYKEGAVITQRDNLMESDRGFFNGDSSTITFVGNVSMRNDNYRIRTDSVRYDFNQEIVTFLSKAYIWDQDRDFLTADRGNYVRATETYHFTHDAYAMTPDQEFWADTMDYESAIRQVTLRSNIQILDTIQRTVGLGDYGYYNDSLKKGMLTDRPAVILYDTVAGSSPVDTTASPRPAFVAGDSLTTAPRPTRPLRPDSAFARADTIFFDSYPPGMSKPRSQQSTDSIAQGNDTTRIESPVSPPPTDSLTQSLEDSTATMADTTTPLSINGTDRVQRVAALLDSLALTDTLPQPNLPDTATLSADTLAQDSGTRRSMIGVEEPPLPVAPDSTLHTPPTTDTLMHPTALQADSVQANQDTLEYVVRGRHNVRLWRSDMQGICDSLTAYSVDSMGTLFGRPILWNGDSQLTADRIDMYSRDGALDYAEFIGSPFLTQKVPQTDSLFNQAEGRLLQTWFRNNEINRAIMTGNVTTYYYRSEDSLQPPIEFLVLTCASLTIDFENQEPVRLNGGGQGNWHVDPINKIPANQPQRLPGFSWSPEKRPQNRYEITNRSVRPSVRYTVEGYTQPQFPIEERFTEAREMLLKKGWRDRNELLDEHRVEQLGSFDLLY